MHDSFGIDLPEELTARLGRLIWRVRLIMLGRGLLATLVVALCALLGVMAVDAAVVLFNPGVRWAFSLAGLGLVVVTGWSMLVRPLRQRLDIVRMARVLETRYPEMQERISSAIELSRGGGEGGRRASAELVRLLTEDAAQDISGVRPRQEFTYRSVRPYILGFVVVVGVLATLFAIWPQETGLLLQRALKPYREIDTLQAVGMEIMPGDRRLLEGEPVRLRLRVVERHGVRAEVYFKREGEGSVVKERMGRVAGVGTRRAEYELLLPAVGESFEYRVRYGSGYTRPYRVEVVREPRVVETRVSYRYPEYTGLGVTQVVGNAQAITGIAGTRVRIETSFERPLKPQLHLNRLVLPGEEEVQARWEQTMVTNRTGRWGVSVRDGYGFTNRLEWAPYIVLQDQPPEIALVRPLQSKLRLPLHDEVWFEGVAADDFGFRGIEMVVRDGKGGEFAVPLEEGWEGERRSELMGRLRMREMHERGLSRFSVALRVSDNLPYELGGPQIRESRGIEITLDRNAQGLQRQERQQAQRTVEKELRQAHRELHEAANRVAEERWSYKQPVLTQKAVEKLERARQSVQRAERALAEAARVAAESPLAELGERIMELRDKEIEPAYQRLEQIPLEQSDKREQAGHDSERELRASAEKINQLIGEMHRDENPRLEREEHLEGVRQREEMLAEQSGAKPMSRDEMRKWIDEQNRAEQQLRQGKPQLSEEEFKAMLEELQQSREVMREAERQLAKVPREVLKEEAERAEERMREAEKQMQQGAEQGESEGQEVAGEEQGEEQGDGVDELAEALQQAAQQGVAAAELAEQAARKAGEAAQMAMAEQGKEQGKEQGGEQRGEQGREEQGQEQAGDPGRGEEVRQAAEEAAAMAEQAGKVAQEAAEGATKALEMAAELGEQPLGEKLAEQLAEAAMLAEFSSDFSESAAERVQQAGKRGREQERGERAGREGGEQEGNRDGSDRGEDGVEGGEADGESRLAGEEAEAALELALEAAAMARQVAAQSAEAASRMREAARARAEGELAERGVDMKEGEAEGVESMGGVTPELDKVREGQQRAGELARSLAQRLGQKMEAVRQSESAARSAVEQRLAEMEQLGVVERGGMGLEGVQQRVPVNLEWARLRGRSDSAAYEEALRRTPPEYRELVKRYFEELARAAE